MLISLIAANELYSSPSSANSLEAYPRIMRTWEDPFDRRTRRLPTTSWFSPHSNRYLPRHHPEYRTRVSPIRYLKDMCTFRAYSVVFSLCKNEIPRQYMAAARNRDRCEASGQASGGKDRPQRVRRGSLEEVETTTPSKGKCLNQIKFGTYTCVHFFVFARSLLRSVFPKLHRHQSGSWCHIHSPCNIPRHTSFEFDGWVRL